MVSGILYITWTTPPPPFHSINCKDHVPLTLFPRKHENLRFGLTKIAENDIPIHDNESYGKEPQFKIKHWFFCLFPVIFSSDTYLQNKMFLQIGWAIARLCKI